MNVGLMDQLAATSLEDEGSEDSGPTLSSRIQLWMQWGKHREARMLPSHGQTAQSSKRRKGHHRSQLPQQHPPLRQYNVEKRDEGASTWLLSNYQY